MAALMSLLRRLRRSEAGAEVIEFALTLPLLLLVVLGMIEFGFVFQEYEVLTNAAREGARIAVLSTYAPTQAARVNNATARANQYLTDGGFTPAKLMTVTVNVGAPVSQVLAAPAVGCVWTVPVTVTYPHPVPFLGGIIKYFGGSYATITLKATSSMRTEAAAATCP
jgi:Flp pilus assembly protein TadG